MIYIYSSLLTLYLDFYATKVVPDGKFFFIDPPFTAVTALTWNFNHARAISMLLCPASYFLRLTMNQMILIGLGFFKCI